MGRKITISRHASHNGDCETLGYIAGEENVSLLTEHLASHNHASGGLSTNSTGAHTHSSGSLTASSAGAHTHNISVPDGGADVNYGSSFKVGGPAIRNTSSAGAHTHNVTGSTSSAGSHDHTVNGSTANTGEGLPHNNMPPLIVVNMEVITG